MEGRGALGGFMKNLKEAKHGGRKKKDRTGKIFQIKRLAFDLFYQNIYIVLHLIHSTAHGIDISVGKLGMMVFS